MLPLEDLLSTKPVKSSLSSEENIAEAYNATPLDLPELEKELRAVGASILGIVTELPTRYGPDQLSVSLGSERVGLAGWIADNRLGRDVELDEETVKMTIADCCERGLLRMTETRRLEATEAGTQLCGD